MQLPDSRPLRLVAPPDPTLFVSPEPHDLRQGHWDKPNTITTKDARDLPLPTGSVGLALTAPPSFFDFETPKGTTQPDRWKLYTHFIKDVISELWQVLEAGGRLALVIDPNPGIGHVAADTTVTAILQAHGFIIRGTLIWAKSLAPYPLNQGVLRGPHDPTIVGVTERIILASKLTTGRRYTQLERRDLDLPSTNKISADNWAHNRLDLWHVPAPEPAPLIHDFPFPIELARRLIETHTYEGELVLDPMCGTGTTALAAHALNRRYYASDISKTSIAAARKRLQQHIGEPVQQSANRHPAAAPTQSKPFQQPTLDLTGECTP